MDWKEKIEEPGHVKRLLRESDTLDNLAREKSREYCDEHGKWFSSLQDWQLETMFRGILAEKKGMADSMSSRYPEAFIRIIDKLRNENKKLREET